MANEKFSRDMRKAEGKIEDAIEKALRGAAIELFGEIVKRTPVGNPSLWKNPAPPGYTGGRLRGNWQAKISSPERSTTEHVDKSGTDTIAKGAQKIRRFTLKDKSIWFSNNLPYADRVEQGWSSQRPAGMVRTTIKMFKPILEKIARIKKV